MMKILANDLYQRAAFAWDSSRNIHDALSWVNMNDLETFDRDAIRSHTTCHACTDWNTSTETSSDRSWLALRVLLTVSARTSVETMTLDHTLETFTFGDCGYRDGIACSELRELYFVSNFESRSSCSWSEVAELSNSSECTKVLEVTLLRLGNAVWITRTLADLERFVAIDIL